MPRDSQPRRSPRDGVACSFVDRRGVKVDYFPAGQNPWERSDLYWALMEGLLDDIWSPDVIREWRAVKASPVRRAKHFV